MSNNITKTLKITNGAKATLLLNQMITNEKFLGRVSKVFNRFWFEGQSEYNHSVLSDILVDWYKKTSKIPTLEMIVSYMEGQNEKKEVYSEIIINDVARLYKEAKDFNTSSFTHEDLVMYLTEFIRKRAMKLNLLEGASKMEMNDDASDAVSTILDNLGNIPKIVFDDTPIGSSVSKGKMIDFENFVHWVQNPEARIATGFKSLDSYLNGGLLKDGKALYVLMAQTGLGKSNIMANMAVNLMKQNLKPLIISLEMSENVYMKRIYSIMSDIEIDSLSRLCDTLRERVESFFNQYPNSGITVKEFPVKSVSSKDIKDYIDRLDYRPDVILIDYLNLLKTNANTKTIQMYEEGLKISEEMRSISQEINIPIITAVQSNTEGMNNDDISLKNISQSRGIAHTADFIGILYKSKEDRDREKEEGKGFMERLYLKIEKSRFGVAGNSIELAYNNKTLKIQDYDNVSNLISTVQKKPSVNENDFDDIFGISNTL